MRRSIAVRFAKAAAVAVTLAIITAATAGEAIFVPPPRGADETLDPTPGKNEGPELDVLKTIQGDVINARLVKLLPDDAIRLEGPQFAGGMNLLLSALDTATMKPEVRDSGGDYVHLTNGDQIIGELLAITAEDVVVESEIAGAVRIPKRLVSSISLGGKMLQGIESKFAEGKMEPWKVRSGPWNVFGNLLQCNSISSSEQAVYAELDQKGPITFIADVQGSSGHSLRCYMGLFADTTEGDYGSNAVFTMLQYSEMILGYTMANNNTHHVANRRLGTSPRQVRLRVAYDPADSKVYLWVDKMPHGEFVIPAKIDSGKYVIFGSRYPIQVKELTVLNGIVPPSEAEKMPEEKADTVRFGNKDRISVQAIALAGGEFAIKTEFGALTPDVESVSNILFRTEGREEPRRRKGDVRVQTAGSLLTLQLMELTPEHLAGKSECYGELKLQRKAIKSIQFNIYR